MRRSALFVFVALALAGPAFAAGTFIPIQTADVQLTQVSPNGEYAVGSIAYSAAYRWSASTATGELLSGMNEGLGINNSGTVSGSVPENGGAYKGGRDLGAFARVGEAPVVLDRTLQTNSTGYGISDGGTVVGLSFDDNFAGDAVAFQWTAADGMSALPVLRPGNYSRANAISADGRVIAGWNDQDKGYRTAVIWIDGMPMDVEDSDGNPVGEASAVTPDGRFVSGSGYTNSAGESGSWIWDAERGVRLVPIMSFAFALAANGKTVIGNTGFFDDPPRAPMIWREGIGTLRLLDYLAEKGVEVPDDWSVEGGLAGLSADGRTLAGWGFGPLGMQSFVIKLDAEDAIFADGFDGAAPPP